MSRYESSLPSSYFDAMYAADPDPWCFAASEYEAEKYEVTLAALKTRRYRRVLEVGCSIGVFTRALADHCDSVLAVDIVRTAIDQAELRCKDKPNVSFEQIRIPDRWPNGRFDLILLSEVVYYFDHRDVMRIAEHAASSLEPNGEMVLVHWTGETHYPLSADDAVETFMAASASFAAPISSFRSENYRLDRLRANASVSRTNPARRRTLDLTPSHSQSMPM